MANSEYVLEMNDITKQFPGVLALNKVSLKIRPGTVHALCGENGAGKSTLMKCLFGIYSKDSGEIIHNGTPVSYSGTLDAIRDRIAMIHQELYPEPFLSVMENIWLGRLPVKHLIIDSRKMLKDTQELLSRLNLNINPKVLVKTLSVSQMQSIEIAKAVSFNAEVIIMDEPTSSLTENEVEHLFSIIEDLKKQSVAIIYISHKIEEIKLIADEVSVMRDGNMICTMPASDITEDEIITKMVGRDMNQRFPTKTNTPGEVFMRIKNYTSINNRSFNNISFDLRRGEILGIAGLVGAQRTELVESIFGIRALESGKINIDDKEVKINCPCDAMNNGLALLTEDRKGSGLFPLLGTGENIYIVLYKKLSNKIGVINIKKCIEMAMQSVKQLSIKTPSLNTPINNLSGGNQQKALFARWLLTEPDVFLLDEPTRGIDVGAKYEIYKIMDDLASQGKCVIMISSEMVELIGMADRIIVMCEGKLTGELSSDEANEEKIMRLATKYMV